jgi:phage repressor protein C with HTH and peptisase S24 domain
MPIVFEVLGAHKPEHCGIVRVTGDSMTDITLNNGDWALFDNHDLKGDGLFVISMFGEMRVKRLQYRLTDRKIIIASENAKRYPYPEIIPVDLLERGELRIHGRVFSWIHKHPY